MKYCLFSQIKVVRTGRPAKRAETVKIATLFLYYVHMILFYLGTVRQIQLHAKLLVGRSACPANLL